MSTRSKKPSQSLKQAIIDEADDSVKSKPFS